MRSAKGDFKYYFPSPLTCHLFWSFASRRPGAHWPALYHSFQCSTTAPDLPLWSKPTQGIQEATESSRWVAQYGGSQAWGDHLPGCTI